MRDDRTETGPLRGLAGRFRAHFGEAGHLYGHLTRAMADDLDGGGVTAEICAGWDAAPAGAMVQLRLLAGLFRVVLRGEAPELAPFYPCLGGEADPAGAWPVAQPVLAGHVAELREALSVAPQTNEPGRSAALLVGLAEAARRTGLRRVRLLEPGASAGLNLLVDRYRFTTPSWSWGPASSPLVLAGFVQGYAAPPQLTIVQRRGCDLEPVDLTTAEGRLRLRSFVWPHQLDRHERLTGALAVARESRVTVDRAPAGAWLERVLARPPADGASDTLTVVWHSITRMYWPTEETERVAAAAQAAAAHAPVVRVAMEYPDGGGDSAVLTLDDEVLGTVGDHGLPVRPV